MLDVKWIKIHSTEFDQMLIKRGMEPMSAQIMSLDERKKELIALIQQFQHTRNKKSKLLGNMRNKTSSEYEETRRDVIHINERLHELNKQLEDDHTLQEMLYNIPNILADDVPQGSGEDMNVLVRSWDGARGNYKCTKTHFELGEELGLIDFTQTVKISGSRFVTLKSSLAKMERALINFMLDVHTQEFGFTELSPPCLVKPSAMYNAGQLPKFGNDSFQTTDGYRLIPTAEVPLVNMVADTIIPRNDLPLRYTAYTPCFRSEAGSAGKDTRGMFRMHQFSKVELVSITTPDESEYEHEYITNVAEEILRKLNLSYQVKLLCSGDLGFTARKTYDLEVWMPGQNKYREISSCSNCGDFQARRMKARYKEFNATETTFVHTLNASGLAVGRTIIAIMENYQNEDGSITIPKCLVSYMGGQTKIESIKQ